MQSVIVQSLGHVNGTMNISLSIKFDNVIKQHILTVFNGFIAALPAKSQLVSTYWDN